MCRPQPCNRQAVWDVLDCDTPVLPVTEGCRSSACEWYRPYVEQQEVSAEDRPYSNDNSIVNAGQYIERTEATDPQQTL